MSVTGARLNYGASHHAQRRLILYSAKVRDRSPSDNILNSGMDVAYDWKSHAQMKVDCLNN